MSIGTFANQVRLLTQATDRSVRHVLPERHIFTQNRFPFISTFFEVASPDLGPGQSKFKTPGTIASMPTYSPEPELYDFGTMPVSFEATGSAAQSTADTNNTIVLNAATGLRQRDLLRNRRTGAQIQVQSVSGSTVTFRGQAGGVVGGGLDAIDAGDKFDLVGNSYPDGATLLTGNISEPVKRSNFLQKHVTETDLGWFAEKTKLYPGSNNGGETDHLINMIRHNMGREKAFLFGKGNQSTINGEFITSMNGLDELSDVEYDCGGAITIDEWRKVISPIVFQAGGGVTKKAVAGNTVLSAFDAMLDGKIMFAQNRSEYDIRLTKITAPTGTVDFMGSEPMNEREGEVLIYDPDVMKRMYLEGFDSVLFEGMAPNNVLKMTDAQVTVETLLCHNPDSIVKLTNILA